MHLSFNLQWCIQNVYYYIDNNKKIWCNIADRNRINKVCELYD